MLKELTNAKTYIVCGYTDMRHSIDGLAAIVTGTRLRQLLQRTSTRRTCIIIFV